MPTGNNSDKRQAQEALRAHREAHQAAQESGFAADMRTFPDIHDESLSSLGDFSSRLMSRLHLAFGRDVYVRMLDDRTRDHLAEVATAAVPRARESVAIYRDTLSALKAIPQAPMFSQDFFSHVAALVTFAVWPQGDPGPARLHRHLHDTHDVSVYIGDLAEVAAERGCTFDPYAWAPSCDADPALVSAR